MCVLVVCLGVEHGQYYKAHIVNEAGTGMGITSNIVRRRTNYNRFMGVPALCMRTNTRPPDGSCKCEVTDLALTRHAACRHAACNVMRGRILSRTEHELTLKGARTADPKRGPLMVDPQRGPLMPDPTMGPLHNCPFDAPSQRLCISVQHIRSYLSW